MWVPAVGFAPMNHQHQNRATTWGRPYTINNNGDDSVAAMGAPMWVPVFNFTPVYHQHQNRATTWGRPYGVTRH